MSVTLPKYLHKQRPSSYDSWDTDQQQAWLDRQRENRRRNAAKWRKIDPSRNHRACMKYRRTNKEKYRAYRNREHDHKMNNDPGYALRHSLRGRLLAALSRDGAAKNSSVESYLGCSLSELMAHLEGQFLAGMTWANRGHKTWHIDHIIPCAAFDHSDPEQVAKCWHYSNLQPMWATDNLKKGCKTNGDY